MDFKHHSYLQDASQRISLYRSLPPEDLISYIKTHNECTQEINYSIKQGLQHFVRNYYNIKLISKSFQAFKLILKIKQRRNLTQIKAHSHRRYRSDETTRPPQSSLSSSIDFSHKSLKLDNKQKQPQLKALQLQRRHNTQLLQKVFMRLKANYISQIKANKLTNQFILYMQKQKQRNFQKKLLHQWHLFLLKRKQTYQKGHLIQKSRLNNTYRKIFTFWKDTADQQSLQKLYYYSKELSFQNTQATDRINMLSSGTLKNPMNQSQRISAKEAYSLNSSIPKNVSVYKPKYQIEEDEGNPDLIYKDYHQRIQDIRYGLKGISKTFNFNTNGKENVVQFEPDLSSASVSRDYSTSRKSEKRYGEVQYQNIQ